MQTADIMLWIQANVWWLIPVVGVVGGVIVKLTPTKVDDRWWKVIKGAWPILTKRLKPKIDLPDLPDIEDIESKPDRADPEIKK